MKTTNRKSLLVAGVCALALSFGTVAYAEKGAETLLRLTKGAAAAKAEAATVAAHKCAKCNDVVTTEPNRQAKAGQVLAGTATQTEVKHTCTECSTSVSTQGAGKAAKQVSIHTCGADVKAACCASN